MRVRVKCFLCLAMAVVIILGCFAANVGAVEWHSQNVARRASGSFKTTVKPGFVAKGNTKLPLDAGETVTVKASYPIIQPYIIPLPVVGSMCGCVMERCPQVDEIIPPNFQRLDQEHAQTLGRCL